MNNTHPLANSKKAPNQTPPMPNLPGSNLKLSQIPSAPSTLQSQVHNICCMFVNLDEQINDTASSWLDADLPYQLEDLLTKTMQANPEVIQFFKRFDLDNIQIITHTGDKPDIVDVICPFLKHLFENPNFIAFLKQLLHLSTFFKQKADLKHTPDLSHEADSLSQCNCLPSDQDGTNKFIRDMNIDDLKRTCCRICCHLD